MKKIWTLFISDLHLGSAFSIWPRNFIGSNGSVVGLNVGQEYVLDHYYKMVREVRSLTKKLDILCIVGDLVHGKNKKGDGEYVIEQNMSFQTKAAFEIISPFVDMSNEIYIFRGSRYHIGINAEWEEFIGYTIRSVVDDFGHHCWMWLPNLNVQGISFDIAHHQSSVMVNRAMPLERERRFSHQVTDIKNNASVIVRAHSHIQTELLLDGELQIGLPPIQLQSDYAQMSKTPNRLLSKWLGMCLVEITPSYIGTIRNPVNVHWLMFKHPPLTKREYKGGKSA